MSARGLDVLDGSVAALCTVGFVVSLVRYLGGAQLSLWVVISLPIVALLALGRIAARRKRAAAPK